MRRLCFALIFLFSFFSFSLDNKFLLFPKNYPKKRGDFAPTFNTNDYSILNFVSRFNAVEIGGVGDITPQRTIVYLKNKGVKRIFCYDWMPAVYYYLDGGNYPFVEWVYDNRYSATLNPDGPFPHTESEGYTFAREYYLDFLNEDVVNRKVDFITNLVIENGYNGIFFDWASGVFILEPEYSTIKSYFDEKHPHNSYLESVGYFYQALKEKCKNIDIQIITNQGYRNAENVLPYTTYDMAESYIVGYDYFGKTLNVDGYGNIEVPETQFFPVSEQGEEDFSDTLYYLNEIDSLIKQYAGEGFKKFIFMDYAAPEFVYNEKRGVYIPKKPKNAIFLSFATAKLINQTSFLEVPFDQHLEFSEIYFVNLGRALEANYEVNWEEKYAVRFYQNGFVFVYFGDSLESNIEIESNFLPGYGFVFDMFSERWLYINRHSISIHIKSKIDPLTGKVIPIGRVFMYEDRVDILQPELQNNEETSGEKINR